MAEDELNQTESQNPSNGEESGESRLTELEGLLAQKDEEMAKANDRITELEQAAAESEEKLTTVSSSLAEAVATLLAKIVAGELMVGSDRLVVKVESAPKGGGMRLPPGGKTSIPSRRVSL